MRVYTQLCKAGLVDGLPRGVRLGKLFTKEWRENQSLDSNSAPRGAETSHLEAVDMIKAIVSKANLKLLGYGSFKDPSNASLDLKKSNRVLYDQIYQNSKMRMQQRFGLPSDEWANNLKSHLSLDYDAVSEKLRNRISKSTISPQLINKVLNVGDIVTLNETTYELYIVVGIVDSLNSNSYTFVNHKGEIVFATRGSIKIRVPAAINDKYDLALKSTVQFEHKRLGVQPIGVPDNKFSKSRDALPKELQDLFKPLPTTDLPDSSTDDSDSVVVEDLVVAQASSQMLTDTAVNTYIVPLAAREVYSEALKQITMSVYNQIPLISAKLRLIHQRLQYDESGDLINTPRTLSVFDLLRDLSECDANHSSLDYTADKATLGKLLAHSTDAGAYPIADYLAMIIALKQQPRLWSIDKYSSSFPPSSVTMISAVRTELLQSTVKYLKTKKGSEKFIKYCSATLGSGQSKLQKPAFYKETVELFRDYITSNVSGDLALENTLVSILRGIDSAVGDRESDETMYKNEYSKSRAYDLLNSLDACENLATYVNPATWSNSLRLPGHNISMESDLSQQYYDFVDFQSSQTEEINDHSLQSIDQGPTSFDDPVMTVREDFTHVPVYCIDSADAHEIDDGISLHEQDDYYVVAVHVANPTSYLSANSILSSIAFDRGSTSYLPEGPLMMFPKLVSNLAGLGIDGRKTRALTVQFKLEKDIVDKYILDSVEAEPTQFDKLKLHAVLDTITKTAKVSFSTIQNFPRGFTYKRVNEFLSEKLLVNDFINNKCSNVDFANLYKLYNISSLLRDVRLVAGDALQFESPQSKITIEKTDPHKMLVFRRSQNGYALSPANSQVEIKIDNSADQDANSMSQLLVSHCMIFANYAAASYAHQNGIEIIHRTQVMNLSPKILSEIQELYSSNANSRQALSGENTAKLLSVLTKARYQVERQAHDSLGLKAYTNVTSPLRRFVDMINHWQFEKHASKAVSNGLLPGASSISQMASHLLSKEIINDNVQKDSLRFWEGIFLKEYFQMVKLGQVPKEDQIEFKLTLKSNIRSQAKASVSVSGFSNLQARVEITDTLLEDYDKNIVKVGDVLDPSRITLTKVDFIENDLVFEYH